MEFKNEPPEKMRTKKQGSTTFKQCGWCEHVIGSHRFTYCIEGSCRLGKSYENEVKWDTKCKFKDASVSEINAIIAHHEYQIRSYQSSITSHKEYIKKLKKIATKAPVRPVLPSDRLVEHFNIDNSIAVFESEDNKWYFGEVKNGYRHQDGCVSFRIDKKGTPQKANDKTFPFKGGFYGCGTAIPNVMLKTEYDFFASNPKQYKIWCDKAYNKEFNGKTLKVPEIKILKQT